jgi:hypothetical protein
LRLQLADHDAAGSRQQELSAGKRSVTLDQLKKWLEANKIDANTY